MVSSKLADPFLVRPALISNPSEQGYLVRTWLGNYRLCTVTRWIPDEVFYWHHHKLVERLYDQANACWLVACDKDDPSIIYGFLAGETSETGPVVHYCFIKSRFRRWGIATKLLAELSRRCPQDVALTATHMTPDGQRFRHDKPIIFNPYVAYYGLPSGWQKRENNADRRSDVSKRRPPARENHGPGTA